MSKESVADDPLGEIPPDHPWFAAVKQVVKELRNESYIGAIAPPGQATNNDTRNYDAGRVAMADDVLARLRRRFEESQRARAG